MAIKVVDQYLKLIGSNYLKKTLEPLINTVYQLKDSCEVDGPRVDAETAKKNAMIILSLLSTFWKNVQAGIDTLPGEFFDVFIQIKDLTTKKFTQDPNVKYGAIRYQVILTLAASYFLDSLDLPLFLLISMVSLPTHLMPLNCVR